MDHLTPLGSGLAGMLVSCRMKKEISGLHETLSLLEQAAAPLTEQPAGTGIITAVTVGEGGEGGEAAVGGDEAAVEEEEEDASKAKEARLHMDSSFPAVPCKTGCNGLLFLRFRADVKQDVPAEKCQAAAHEPVSLFRSVLETLDAGRAPRPVYVQRMFPVQTTCEPLLSDIVAALRALLVTTAADPATGALQPAAAAVATAAAAAAAAAAEY